MIRSWTLSSLEETNSLQYFSSDRTATALHSKESDAESSSDEEFIDPLQIQVVDKNAEANGSIRNKMRAQQTDETMFRKQVPLEHRKSLHQEAVRRGYPYQAANGTGYSDEGESCPHQGNDRLTRRPRYSNQLERTPVYSENKASAGPQQYQWKSAFRRPVYSYQQANYCYPGRPEHEANARANQLSGKGRLRRLEVSYQLASCSGYSYQQERQNTQRYETVQSRRSMPQWSRHGKGARLPPIQQSTRIQQHSQAQGLVAVRRCGRQEVREEANQGRAKRNGVCYETDDTKKQRMFLRVLEKRF